MATGSDLLSYPNFYQVKFVGPVSGDGMALDAPPGKVQLDRGRMSASCVLVATSRDREGEVIEASGGQFENHRRNPVVMLDHGKRWPLPIGVTRSPEGEYTLRYDADADELWETTYFSQSNAMAQQVYGLIDEGILAANSLGFQALEARPTGQKKPDGKAAMHITSWDLIEPTWTGLPVNPEAVRKALDRNLIDGKSLIPELRCTLEPLASARKVWSRGAKLGGVMGEKSELASGLTPETGNAMIPDTEEAKVEPHSAVAHRAVYEHCKAIEAMHEERLPGLLDQINPLEHEGARKFLTKHIENLSGMLDQHMAKQEDAFEKHHPDLPPLAPEGEHHGEDEERQGEADKVQKEDVKQPAAPAGKALSAMDETAGGALVPPPGHPHICKASAWLTDLGSDGKHPNLDHGQKAACLYHGEKLKSLSADLGSGLTLSLGLKSQVEPELVAVVGTITPPAAKSMTEEIPAEAIPLLTDAILKLTEGAEREEKALRKTERRLRIAGVNS